MKSLVDIKEVDREFYRKRLARFLPGQIVDIHTHVWRSRDFPRVIPCDARLVTWPSRVAKENPIEDLMETYRLMLPDRQVTPLIFATLPAGGNLDRQNTYVAGCAHRAKVPALIFSDPKWSAEELTRRIRSGGFLGAKSYVSMVPDYIPGREVRILDFFPPHQLEVHDRHGWIVMLHIPRDGRLKDPVNLQQMLQIEREFPRIKLIIAHVGRAYCDSDVGNAFEVLGASKRMLFDFSANTNASVFEQLLRRIGPRRVLFGSDMPITRMRMRRITTGGHYVNLVPKGAYGDLSNDKNMAELEGKEAEKLTFFLYEEIDAFRRAAERLQFTARDIRDVFHDNACRLFRAGRKP